MSGEVAGLADRVDVHAIGDLAGHLQHPRIHGGDVDGRIGNVDRAGAPLTVQEVEIVELAVVIERFAAEAGEARLDSTDVVAQTGARVVELDAVASHHMRAYLCAEAEPEAPARQFLELPGDLRRDHRAARERHRDTRRHLEARCGQRRCGDCRVRGSATLGEEHAVEAGPLGPLGDRPISRRDRGRVITSTRTPRP